MCSTSSSNGQLIIVMVQPSLTERFTILSRIVINVQTKYLKGKHTWPAVSVSKERRRKTQMLLRQLVKNVLASFPPSNVRSRSLQTPCCVTDSFSLKTPLSINLPQGALLFLFLFLFLLSLTPPPHVLTSVLSPPLLLR